MKLSQIYWQLLQAVSLASAATSSPSHLVLLDHHSTVDYPSSPDTISPTLSKLILAQRLGLSDQYSIENIRPDEIDLIDRYGGPRQHPLIGLPPSGFRALVVLEGVDDIGRIVAPDASRKALQLSSTPHTQDTRQLVQDFVDSSRQAQSHANYGFADLQELLDFSPSSGNTFSSYGDKVFIRVSSLERLSTKYGASSSELADEFNRVKNMFSKMHSYGDFTTITMLSVPSESHCGKKAGAEKTYGGLSKRSTSANQRRSEFPMHGEADQKQQPKASRPAAHPLAAGSIPSRFPSLNACERTTSNCTGHGECKIVATETGKNSKKEYYGCVCKPESKGDKGSKKTTYYGGAACQKKDVVAPFWLLAGTTIFLVSVVTMGVGLLYSMGSDELPSVIGAGVSGPRAK